MKLICNEGMTGTFSGKDRTNDAFTYAKVAGGRSASERRGEAEKPKPEDENDENYGGLFLGTLNQNGEGNIKM